MYRAKWDGKNRYVVFESGMQDAIQSRMDWRWTFASLDNGEFFLIYQPTFDLTTWPPPGSRR